MPPKKLWFSTGFVHFGVAHEAVAAMLGEDDDDDKIALHHINDPPSNLNASPLQVD